MTSRVLPPEKPPAAPVDPVVVAKSRNGFTRRARPHLGTLVEIALPTDDSSAFDAAFAVFADIHRLMSFHDSASDLARLRKARPDSVTTVAPETAEVLACAIALHGQSNGLFDVTVGRRLVRSGFLPRDGLVHVNRFPGRMTDISFSGPCQVRQDRIALIDFGGIAKGYAVDRAVEVLRARGVTSGMVNAGGDLRIFGEIFQTVSLRRGDGRILELDNVRDLAIASSENKRNRRLRRGETRTPHIHPAGQAVLIDGLVSVAANRCMIADAMTKIAMIDRLLAERLLEPHDGRVLYCSHE